MFEFFLKDSSFLWKTDGSIFSTFGPTLTPRFFLKIAEMEKVAVGRDNFSHVSIQICQNQGFISSPLSGKKTITFCNIWAIFAGKQGGLTCQGVRIKIWQFLFHSHDSRSTFCQKILVPAFSSFAAVDHKEHFRKILTQIFKFGCVSWYHAYFFQNNEIDLLMQNLILKQLASISNPKNKKAKSSYALF